MTTNRCRSLYLRLGIASLLGSAGAIVLSPNIIAIAQVVADPSISTLVTPNGTTFQITGGTTVGSRNLFHSFSRFDVPTGGVADFLNNPNIVNIFSRVTGGTPSQIDGIVRSGGTANLFLMNPSGIIFGQNAQLDVGGSFVATTANAIQFGDRGFFSASGSELPSPLLTINPSAFLFNQINNLGTIENQSRANAGRDPSNSFNVFGLRVSDGQSLLLLGGNVNIDGGGIVAFGGQIDIGALAGEGSVRLTFNGNELRLNLPDKVLRSDISLTNSAGLLVAAGGGGDVSLTGRNINLLQNSSIEAGILGGLGTVNSYAGDIKINATNLITVEGGLIRNSVFSRATGNSGDIKINSNQLFIKNGGLVYTDIYGKGRAGDLLIQVKDLIEVVGEDSFLSSDLLSRATGKGGNLTIDTRSLNVRDGAQVSASTYGTGNSGNLTIHATESIKVAGTSSDGRTLSKLAADVYQGSEGKGGNLTIDTPQLVVADGGQVGASTFGKGNAGNVTVNADFIELRGVSPKMENDYYPAGLFTEVKGEGNGGKLTITTRNLRIIDGARVSGISFGIGDAGDVTINSSDLVQVVGSSPDAYFLSKVATEVGQGGIGNSGNLTINTPRLIVKDGGQISSSTFGKGDAGILTVDAGSINLQGFSPDNKENGYYPAGLFTEVKGEGRGGQLKVTTNYLSITDGARISAITFGKGDAGDVSINASKIVEIIGTSPDVYFSSKIATDVGENATGNSGNLTITSPNLIVKNGAQISSSTFGKGDAGRLLIHSKDLVEVVGQNSFLTADVNSGATGQGGSLTIEAKRLSVRDGGQIGSSTFGTGNAGDVFVHAPDIDIFGTSANGNPSGLFSTSSQNARGNGGNLFIEARNLNLSNSGQLSSQSRGSGTAGNITVNARNIRMRGNSDILTISNSGDGGNITLNAQTIVALENSDILAFAPAGRGGNITFNTRAFLSDPLYRPSPSIPNRAALFALLANDRADVNASGTVSGTVSGVPDISFLQNSLTQLPTSLTDTTQLLANSCIVRRGQPNGSFKITGSGGLPQRPGDASVSPFPTGEVRSLPKQIRQTEITPSSSETRPWKIGDPIVEPQGVYKLANGQLVMSRECTFQQQRSQH